MKYDPKVVMEFAARLYARAKTTVIVYTTFGIIVGLGVGGVLGKALIGMIVIGAIGYVLGTERAFQFKLQAQLALCQVQIEKNTGKT